MLAITGPLGREAVLESTRMREIEEWIWKAEAENLSAEQIHPARRRLALLAKQDPRIHWEQREDMVTRQPEEESASSQAQRRLKLAEQQADLALHGTRETGGGGYAMRPNAIEQLKDAITECYNTGVDVKHLLSARRRLQELTVDVPSKPLQPPKAKHSFAKDMLEAMKEKDPAKLQRVLDAAAEADVQLPGLEAARRKLAEWKPAARVPERTSSQVRLRIILPDGRRGWLPVDANREGNQVLASLPHKEGHPVNPGELHFCLGFEAVSKGPITLDEEVEFALDRRLCDQPKFLAEGATLCVCPGRGRTRRENPQAQAPDDSAQNPTNPLWQSVMRAISEPFPTFVKVERILEESSGWPAVVLAWGGADDAGVAARCAEAVQAVGACRLLLSGHKAAAEAPSLGIPSSCMAMAETSFGSAQVLRVVAEIEAAGIQRPFLLVLVCRGYLSRRLVLSFRQHLPEDVSLFPCPPAQLSQACAEEVPFFKSRIFEEARLLHSEGVQFTARCLQALDRLQPSWRDGT